MRIFLAYIVVVLIWSTTPLGIKFSVSEGSVLLPLIARTVIGLLFTLVCLGFISERVSFGRLAMKTYMASVLGIVGSMALTYWSAQFIASGLIAVLWGLAPIMAGLFAMPILKESFFGWRKLLGIAIAMSGLAVIFKHELALSTESWKGIAGVLIATVLHGLSMVLVKRYGTRLSPLGTNAGSLLFSLPPLALIFLFGAEQKTLSMGQTVMLATIYLGFFGSFLAFVLHFYVIKKLSPMNASMIMLITPVLALALGHVLNDEVISVTMIIGAALVLLGLLIFQFAHIARMPGAKPQTY